MYIKIGKVYDISYTADPERYDSVLPTIQTMINVQIYQRSCSSRSYPSRNWLALPSIDTNIGTKKPG